MDLPHAPSHSISAEDYARSLRAKAAAYNKRGLASYESQRYQQALVDLHEAIRCDLNYADAYLNRSLFHNLVGDRESSVLDACIAIELTRYAPEALLTRSLAYANQSFLQNALEDCDYALQTTAMGVSPEGDELQMLLVSLRCILLFKIIRSHDHQFFESMSLFEGTLRQLEQLLFSTKSASEPLYRGIWAFLKANISSSTPAQYRSPLQLSADPNSDTTAEQNAKQKTERETTLNFMQQVSSRDIADLAADLSANPEAYPTISNVRMIQDAMEQLCSSTNLQLGGQDQGQDQGQGEKDMHLSLPFSTDSMSISHPQLIP